MATPSQYGIKIHTYHNLNYLLYFTEFLSSLSMTQFFAEIIYSWDVQSSLPIRNLSHATIRQRNCPSPKTTRVHSENTFYNKKQVTGLVMYFVSYFASYCTTHNYIVFRKIFSRYKSTLKLITQNNKPPILTFVSRLASTVHFIRKVSREL